MWQQTVSSNAMKWEQALAHCEGLNLAPYRLAIAHYQGITKPCGLQPLQSGDQYNFFPIRPRPGIGPVLPTPTMPLRVARGFRHGNDYVGDGKGGATMPVPSAGTDWALDHSFFRESDHPECGKNAKTTTFSVSNTGTEPCPWSASIISGVIGCR